MIRFQADADLRHQIVRAVRLREPRIDIASAAEGGIIGLADPEVLDRAARADRILVTHDRRTIPHYFRMRLSSGGESPGVFIVAQREPVGRVAEFLAIVWAASGPEDWRDQIRYLPSFSPHCFRD